MYPGKEFYTEQLIVRPEGEGLDPSDRIALSFQPRYYSYLGYTEDVQHQLARFEHIPDYFTVWKSFATQHRGLAFVSDSHVRNLEVTPSEIRWRLQLGHEYRCVHHFPFHCWPDEGLAPFHEVGHTGWYERLLRPLRAQLVGAIVGYPQFDVGIDKKPSIPKRGETLKGLDLKHISPRPALPGPLEPLRVFISYSHKDERLRRDLETHLKLLRRQEVIATWTDRRIMPGEEWRDQIDENLESADIILLLVSADFVASDYCYEVEMKRALKRHDAGEARVIPIILREVDWHSAPFAKLQALPREGKAVMLWRSKDSAWKDVAASIRTVAEQIRSQKSEWNAGL
jgi:hypothetical protein